MVDPDRNLKRLTSLLMLVGVLAFPIACQEVEPLRGCEGSAANCGDPDRFLCVQDRCVRQDPCGAGIFRFNGRGGGEAPYVAETLTPQERLSADQVLVRQVFSPAQLRESLRVPTFDGEAMLLPADGQRYPFRFEVDFFDAADTKNTEERIAARNGQILGVYVEARISLDENALECSAYLAVWANATTYAKICLGGEAKLYVDQGERQKIPLALDALTDFDPREEHIYRLDVLPTEDETGRLVYLVEIRVDGNLIRSLTADNFKVPTERPGRYVLYQFGSENSGGSRWDYVRWGCNPNGGPCYIALLGDDDAFCTDGRNSGGAIRCPGGRGVAEEICDGIDNNCDSQPDEIFRKAFGPTALLLDNPLDPTDPSKRLELDETCQIGVCSQSRVRCHPTDPLGLICDPADHFRAVGASGPPAETCNGLDDDCDGAVDEDFGPVIEGRPDSGKRRYVDPTLLPDGRREPNAEDIATLGAALREPCGRGGCQGGVVQCNPENERPVCSNPPKLSTAEECGNGLDDDCDGRIDEGKDTTGDGIIDTEGDKDGDGFQECNCAAAGRQTPCAPNIQLDCDDTNRNINPGAVEVCNDRDDNCNGQTDEGFDLDGDGFWSCPRVCPPERCTEGVDCCLQGPGGDRDITRNRDCVDLRNDNLSAQIFPGAEEVCNNEDDDCDGRIDEGNGPDDPGFVNNPTGDNPIARGYFTPAHCGRCGNDCTADAGRLGKNFRNQCDRVDGLYRCSIQCAEGFFDANGNDADGCECTPIRLDNCNDGDQNFGIASAVGCVELCDGFDNDCDGRIDEGAPINPAVIEVLRDGGQRADLNQLQLVTRPCFTGGANLQVDRAGGRCRTGRMSCIGGEQVGGRADQCLGQELPMAEICNSVDDDCDGQVDEQTPREGTACAVPGARGVCSDGRFTCQNGNEICQARFQPRPEICNLVDDDCDGRIDEGFDLDGDGFRTCGGIEACRPGVQPTTAAGDLNCDDDDDDPFNNCICPDDCNDDPDTGALINRTQAEICNNVDDNCSGSVDEPFVRLDATGRPVLRGGSRIYSVSTQHCSRCGLNCEGLPNVLPGSTRCFDDTVVGACEFECLPNYQNRDGDWTNGCETAQCTVETVGAVKVGLLGRPCQKPIYEDPNPNDGVDVCACQGTFTCVEPSPGQFDVRCVVSVAIANIEPERVTVEQCIQAAGDRSLIRNERQETCDDFDNDCDGRIDEDFKDDRGNYSTQDHCGACDSLCRANNAAPRCVRGICTLDQADCNLNFYDSNGRLDDGCEYFCVKTSNDDRICDGIDNDCDGCRREDPDCDFDAFIDEDVLFAVDAQNCGVCGNVCAFPNAVARCTNEQCVIDRAPGSPNTAGCVAGFADCDAQLANGCEIRIATDRNNCGACGTQCSPTASNACTGGVCTCGARASCNDPNRPICDAEAAAGQECVECLTDDQCADNAVFGGTGRQFCINKICRECNPLDSSGCDGVSTRPICDRVSLACRQCQNDAQCTVLFADRQVCVTEQGNPDRGQCVLCDPNTNAGCGGSTPTCQRNGDGSYVCRACGNDADCGGNRTCILDDPNTGENEARCSGCNLQTNEGCGNPTPICRSVAGAERCTGCQNNAECPGGQECVEGSCRQCNPLNNAGCRANELCCNFECVAANNVNGCEVCGVTCNEVNSRTCLNRECVCGDAGSGACGGATPFCDDPNRVCVSCRNDVDCPAGPRPLCVPTVVGGAPVPQCQECDPATNRGCDPNSANPVCDPQRYICRACAADGECGEPGRGQCVANGSCQLCDPADNAGCSANGASVCTDQFQCRGCQNASECGANPNGNLCINQRCEGCGGADPDTACAAHPLGNVCNASVGGAPRRCGPCDVELTGEGGSLLDCDSPRQAGQREGHPAGNICRNSRCVACNADVECAVVNPDEPYCVQGRCQACDPLTDRPCLGALPVCNPFSFECEACVQDADCNDGSLCVGGSCVRCDVANNRGCPVATPVCAGQPPACRPCVSDLECAGSAEGPYCFEGQCRPCSPASDAGCLPNSATPVCSPAFQCVGCANDADCASNPNNGGQCIAGTGRCRTCDPADHAGCSDAELCCNVAGTPTCQATTARAGGQCEACGQACDPLRANVCNTRDCGCGNGGACDPNGNLPRCGANGCVQCLEDADCPGAAVCNTSNNTCQACRLGTHEGCGANELCCNQGGAPTCVATGAGPDDACSACGASCDQARSNLCVNRECRCGVAGQCTGGTPFCDDNVNNGGQAALCVECLNDTQCPGDDQCVGFSCGECDPGDNRGCNPASTTPFCRALGGGNECRGCNNNADCAAEPNNGSRCVRQQDSAALAGACVACLVSADCDLASGQPVCDAQFQCVRCVADAQCAGNPNGNRCDVVSGQCVACVNDAQCDQQGQTPICGTANGVPACVGCANNAQCLTSPVGPNCHPDGSCEVCVTNADCVAVAGQPICDSQSRTCRACTTNDLGGNPGHDDCEGFAGRPVCDLVSGTCQACVGNGDCGANQLCCEGAEGPACVNTQAGLQCTACGTACNAEAADTCTNRSCQCGAGAPCQNGTFCVAGACVACRNDNDCQGTDICSAAGQCGAPNNSVCQANAECASGYCQEGSGLCRPATCNDLLVNGGETALNCGGPCGLCENQACTVEGVPVDGNCRSGFCQASTGVCRPFHCSNNVVDGALGEDGLNCGQPCGLCNGGICAENLGCESGYCQSATGLCRPAHCNNEVQDGNETGLNCGGSCGACDDNPCLDGDNQPDDQLCQSGYCQPHNNVCRPSHCGNGVVDAGEGEIGVDCGPLSGCGLCQGVECNQASDCETGLCEASTGVCRPFHCGDGNQNGPVASPETGVDCGGVCSACDGAICDDPVRNANDGLDFACKSGYCQTDSNLCRPLACSPAEPGDDCGGLCGACDEVPCAANGDCASGFCHPRLLVCRPADCNNNEQDMGEGGVDCGNAACGACNNADCTVAGEADDHICSSGYCEVGSRRCRPATCGDGILNGDESLTDCGGPDCGACDTGGCAQGTDCFSGYCQVEGNQSNCRPATCTNGIKDANETAVDCGDDCGPTCAFGQACDDAGDCVLNHCLVVGGPGTTCRECDNNAHCAVNPKGTQCLATKECGCTVANDHCGAGQSCTNSVCVDD